jgi:subtilisin family serine protease
MLLCLCYLQLQKGFTVKKLAIALAISGVFANTSAQALSEEQKAKAAAEVQAAQSAANAAWWANYAAILADQDRRIAEKYKSTPNASKEVNTSLPVVPNAPTATLPSTPIVAPPMSIITAPVVTPLSKFDTAEYTADSIVKGKTNDDFLRVINASAAWDRGYTGKGSLILIIDSGINPTHSEFAGSVAYTKIFNKSKFGINDQTGHGTRMAGAAAANWDGVGMAGVAPDAQLAIAKVTDKNAIGFSQVKQAVAWGASIDATVANISANTRYMSQFTGSFYQLADGSWANNNATYIANYYNGRRSTGFYLGEDPKSWAKALGNSEMVIVNSAGNSGRRFPENPAPMAYATRPDGTLYLNGQMLVVGAFDIPSNTIANYSNKAGHLCQGFNIVNGTCTDTYRMSDFFILAPGNLFSPGKTGDTYVIGTGTSEAAAVVSGAVAVVRQQWPLMTGANIVKLLTATANKNIANYDKDVMGAGLLDLEKATRPFGQIGIPIDGRYGKTAPVDGVFSTNTSGGLASVSSLSAVMVVDEFGRDYYVDLSSAANAKRPRADFNPIAKANFYEDYNPYTKLNHYTFNGATASGAFDVKMSLNDFTNNMMFESGKAIELNKYSKMRIGFGMMNEQNAWMGNQISGSLGRVSGSITQFMNVSGVYNFNRNLSAFGSAWLGYTQANLQNPGLITNVSNTQSYSWNVGLDYTKKSHSFGATFSQPVTVYQGTVDVNVPVGYNANGTIAYDRTTANISPSVLEHNLGIYYKYKTDTMSLIAFGEHQNNYLNQNGVTNQQIGLAINKRF